MVEYAILVSIIAAALVLLVPTLTTAVGTGFTNASTAMTGG
jgi:Flp pilus assembly pilin Flp